MRTAATKALASFSRAEDLTLLRELAKDKDRDVRTAAMKALASSARPEALPVLRKLAKDKVRDVRTAATKALASLSGPRPCRRYADWLSHPMTKSPQRLFSG
jgi:HEAT repeat protein